MEERVSGFRVRGSWDDVVAHGERIARALQESDVDVVALAEWEGWRPKANEELGEEVSEKTVEQARIEEGAGEQAGQAAREDLERASEHALEHGLRAVDTTTRKAIPRSRRRSTSRS
jgi:predicted TIM-barrel fold metal-dependent hydrolase